MMSLLELSACAPAQAPPEKAVELVEVQPVEFTPTSQTVSLVGTVTARVESELSFRVAGRITERSVDISDRVAAGDVLARLETEEQEADVQSARATLEATDATLVQAQANFDRQAQLFSGGYTTRSILEGAQEQLLTAQSSVETARADLQTAQEQLSFTVLRADAAGVITARNAEAGQVVSAAQTVFTLAQDGVRDATFDVYEALISSAPPSSGIEVKLVSDPSIKAFATVREVSPTFDTSTGTVRVKMSLIDPPEALSLGATVAGTAQSEPEDLVALPWTALGSGETGPVVWIVDPETNAVASRDIVVARYRTGEFLVREGLADGDLVVTRGGQFLREGQVIAISSGAAS